MAFESNVKLPVLSYNLRLNQGLKDMGFKRKNKYTFVLKDPNITVELCGADSAHGFPHTKFYSFSIFMYYDDIAEKVNQIQQEVYPCLLGSPIPEYNPAILGFKEWRLDINSTEDDYNNAVDEILYIIRAYIYPLIVRWKNKENLIKDYETGAIDYRHNGDVGYVIPMLYYQMNEFDNVRSSITFFRKMYHKSIVYLSFADKFIKMIEDNR